MLLDLRQTKCPLNFVKAKLALEKMAAGQRLEIWLAAEGESALNVPESLRQEGHTVTIENNHAHLVLRVQKA